MPCRVGHGDHPCPRVPACRLRQEATTGQAASPRTPAIPTLRKHSSRRLGRASPRRSVTSRKGKALPPTLTARRWESTPIPFERAACTPGRDVRRQADGNGGHAFQRNHRSILAWQREPSIGAWAGSIIHDVTRGAPSHEARHALRNAHTVVGGAAHPSATLLGDLPARPGSLAMHGIPATGGSLADS